MTHIENHLQVLQTGNLAPVKQESKLPATSEERLFQEALQTPAIYHSPVEELKEVLRYAMVKIGLRSQNWPVDEEKQVLIDHILANYGTHTHAEIRLAFDMAIVGKLDVEVNCYENFSCAYVSNILNAYRKWASQVHVQLKGQEKPKELDAKKTLTEEEYTEWFEEIRQLVVDGKLKMLFIPVELFTYLERKKELELTKEEKHAYMDKAIDYRHSELSARVTDALTDPDARRDLKAFNEMREKGFQGTELNRLKDLARKIAVFDYIQTVSF